MTSKIYFVKGNFMTNLTAQTQKLHISKIIIIVIITSNTKLERGIVYNYSVF